MKHTESSYCTLVLDSVVDESSSERLLGVTINNDLSWNTHVENVITIHVIHFCTYCLELKYFSLFETENGLTMLILFPILIYVALFGVIVLQSWKTNL